MVSIRGVLDCLELITLWFVQRQRSVQALSLQHLDMIEVMQSYVPFILTKLVGHWRHYPHFQEVLRYLLVQVPRLYLKKVIEVVPCVLDLALKLVGKMLDEEWLSSGESLVLETEVCSQADCVVKCWQIERDLVNKFVDLDHEFPFLGQKFRLR